MPTNTAPTSPRPTTGNGRSKRCEEDAMSAFNFQEHEITVGQVHRNLPVGALYEHAIRFEKDASIAQSGALVAYSGAKTGRSPTDKRVVKDPASEKDIWWG